MGISDVSSVVVFSFLLSAGRGGRRARYEFLFFKQKTAYEMRISDWSSDVCSSDLGVDHAVAGIFGLLGELDDEDGVLRRQADQHDEADLSQDVVVEAAQGDADHCRSEEHTSELQ